MTLEDIVLAWQKLCSQALKDFTLRTPPEEEVRAQFRRHPLYWVPQTEFWRMLQLGKAGPKESTGPLSCWSYLSAPEGFRTAIRQNCERVADWGPVYLNHHPALNAWLQQVSDLLESSLPESSIEPGETTDESGCFSRDVVDELQALLDSIQERIRGMVALLKSWPMLSPESSQISALRDIEQILLMKKVEELFHPNRDREFMYDVDPEGTHYHPSIVRARCYQRFYDAMGAEGYSAFHDNLISILEERCKSRWVASSLRELQEIDDWLVVVGSYTAIHALATMHFSCKLSYWKLDEREAGLQSLKWVRQGRRVPVLALIDDPRLEELKRGTEGFIVVALLTFWWKADMLGTYDPVPEYWREFSKVFAEFVRCADLIASILSPQWTITVTPVK